MSSYFKAMYHIIQFIARPYRIMLILFDRYFYFIVQYWMSKVYQRTISIMVTYMEHNLHQPYDNIDIVRWYLHWLHRTISIKYKSRYLMIIYFIWSILLYISIMKKRYNHATSTKLHWIRNSFFHAANITAGTRASPQALPNNDCMDFQYDEINFDYQVYCPS